MSVLRIGSGNRLIVYCSYEDRTIVNKLGGVWQPIDKSWNLPFTVENVERLLKKLPNVSADDKVKIKLEDQRRTEEKLQQIKRVANSNKPVKFRIPGIKLSLYNYQKLGVMFAINNPEGILLADDMGLGKSCQAIATACYKKYVHGMKKCLVIVPASLKWNWPLEIEKFTDESYVVIDGSPDKRLKQWNSKAFFYIVNYELVLEDLFGGKEITIKPSDDAEKQAKKKERIRKAKERAEQLSDVRDCQWEMIVVDEAAYLKAHKAKRTKNVKELNADYRMALTGTPMDGKLEELHSVMQFVVPGLFRSKTKFLEHHAEFDFWGKIVKYKKIPEVQDKMKNFFLRRLKKDVLEDLPDKIYSNRYVLLTGEEMQTYKELAERGHEITEDAEAMVAVIRCKQFCDHPELIDLSMKNNSKMEEFLKVIDEVVAQNCNKAIVFSQYSSMTEIIIRELDKIGLKSLYICGDTNKKERAEMQERFNTDQTIDVIVGTDAMSMGLNFTAANYVINYDDNWSPSIMNQREDRSYRIGQKNVVTVVNFICKDTIEERIRGVLSSKASVTAEILGDKIDEMVIQRLGPQDLVKLL